MPQEGITNFRQQYPQYNDLTDDQILQGMYRKYYSDMSENDFRSKFEKKFGALSQQPEEKTGLIEGVKQRLTPTIDSEAPAPSQRPLGESFFKALLLPMNIVAGLLPTKGGEFNDSEETLGEAVARGKFPWEALTDDQREELGYILSVGSQTGAPTQEEAKTIGGTAADIALDPLTYVGIGLGKRIVNLVKTGKTAEAGKAVEELAKTTSKVNIDDFVKSLGKSEDESLLKTILGDIKEGRDPNQIVEKIAKENIDVSKLPNVKDIRTTLTPEQLEKDLYRVNVEKLPEFGKPKTPKVKGQEPLPLTEPKPKEPTPIKTLTRDKSEELKLSIPTQEKTTGFFDRPLRVNERLYDQTVKEIQPKNPSRHRVVLSDGTIWKAEKTSNIIPWRYTKISDPKQLLKREAKTFQPSKTYKAEPGGLEKTLEGQKIQQTYREFVESKGYKWEQISGKGSDKELYARLFDEYNKGTLSGKEYASGLLKAVKEDITSKVSGIAYDPYRNVKQFIAENNFKLTDDEIKALWKAGERFAKVANKTEQERQVLLSKWIQKELPHRLPIEQPMGAKIPTTPGYNVEKFHPTLKEELPRIVEEFRAEFNQLRGERLTVDQAIETATKKAANMVDNDLTSIVRGEARNATDVLAARLYSNNKLLEMGDKLKTFPKEATGEIFTELKHRLDMFLKARQLMGEAGRTLRYGRIPIGDDMIAGLKNLVENLKKIDKKSADQLSQLLIAAEELPGMKEKILFWWYNGMLSNPFTDLANITGNTSHFAWEFGLNAIENPLGLRQMIKGTKEGFIEGLSKAKAIYQQDKQALSKFADIGDLKHYDVYPKTKLGKFFRSMLPTTRLSMEDAIASAMAKNVRIRLGASKIAKAEKVSVDEVVKNIKKIIDDPTFTPPTGNDKIYRQLAEYSDKYAEYLTFRTPLKSQFAKGAQSTLWVKPFVPFVRVLANITKAGYKSSPLGFIKLFGKEAKALSVFERQDIIRRALAGTVFYTGTGTLMADGKIEVTGSGPDTRREREAWDKLGYKPNHVYVVGENGEKTGISYQNINPFNVVLAVMGNWQDQYRFGVKLKDDEKTFSEKLSYALAGAAATMSDQSFMQGVNNLFDWIKYKDEKYLEDFFTKPFIPNIVGFPRNLREYARGEKPRYQATTWYERLKRRVGLYEGLTPTYSAYGGQKESGYERFPFFPSKIKRDPLLENLISKYALVSVPSKNTLINDRKMTDEEYAEYVKNSAEGIMIRLRKDENKIMEYNTERTQDIVDDIVKKEREKAKYYIAKKARSNKLLGESK